MNEKNRGMSAKPRTLRHCEAVGVYDMAWFIAEGRYYHSRKNCFELTGNEADGYGFRASNGERNIGVRYATRKAAIEAAGGPG